MQTRARLDNSTLLPTLAYRCSAHWVPLSWASECLIQPVAWLKSSHEDMVARAEGYVAGDWRMSRLELDLLFGATSGVRRNSETRRPLIGCGVSAACRRGSAGFRHEPPFDAFSAARRPYRVGWHNRTSFVS